MDFDIPGKDVLIHYPIVVTQTYDTIRVEIPGVFSEIDKVKLVQLGWNFINPHVAVFCTKSQIDMPCSGYFEGKQKEEYVKWKEEGFISKNIKKDKSILDKVKDLYLE